jgi:glycosyltransferase involved in cell wall biosynthesis
MDDCVWKSGRLGVVLPRLAAEPAVSIVIPCYQEEEHIETVVKSAATQRYPQHLVEILVVDGGSVDRTCEIVRALAAEDPRIKLLHNPARLQAPAMNMAIVRSRGDVIVRMDAHADYDENYVAAGVAALRRTGALNVGGAVRLRARTTFQRALCLALESPLGVGGSGAWNPAREGFVESVWGGVFRREAFELVGLYDPQARTNEDAELCQRIIERGGRVYQSREVINHYYPRKSLTALFRQYLAYGNGRARTFCRRGKLLSPRPMVPFIALTTFVMLVLASMIEPQMLPVLLGAIALYLLVVIAEALRASKRVDIRLLPRVAAIFPVMHVAHGIGFAVGLVVHAGRAAREEEPERLAVR